MEEKYARVSIRISYFWCLWISQLTPFTQFNGRTLRVDFAEEGNKQQDVVIPQQPLQGPILPQSNIQNEINKLIDVMSPTQLYEVMVQLKVNI